MKSLFGRLFFALIIILIIGGAIKLFGLNELDVCNDGDLTENMTESKWTIEGGAQAIEFKEDGTFILYTVFSDDGVSQYNGTFRLLDCKESSSVADSRDVELNFKTDGELTDELGSSAKIYFTSENYKIIHLGDLAYYKVSEFKNLTKDR